jgi:hypothetical protein
MMQSNFLQLKTGRAQEGLQDLWGSRGLLYGMRMPGQSVCLASDFRRVRASPFALHRQTRRTSSGSMAERVLGGMTFDLQTWEQRLQRLRDESRAARERAVALRGSAAARRVACAAAQAASRASRQALGRGTVVPACDAAPPGH